jgi:hypothetical protein
MLYRKDWRSALTAQPHSAATDEQPTSAANVPVRPRNLIEVVTELGGVVEHRTDAHTSFTLAGVKLSGTYTLKPHPHGYLFIRLDCEDLSLEGEQQQGLDCSLDFDGCSIQRCTFKGRSTKKPGLALKFRNCQEIADLTAT